jgi:hypothetical protein
LSELIRSIVRKMLRACQIKNRIASRGSECLSSITYCAQPLDQPRQPHRPFLLLRVLGHRVASLRKP